MPVRLAEVLLGLGRRYGVLRGPWLHLPFRMTHQDWAELIGGSRETVSLTLAAWARSDLVRTGRAEIWLWPEPLQRWLLDQNSPFAPGRRQEGGYVCKRATY